jgi:glycosyltransferase involved in cell wall biosynthesis
VSLRYSIIIPAHNEDENIERVLARLLEEISVDTEILVVVDSPEDRTLGVLEHSVDPRVKPLINTYGRGPAQAIKFGVDNVKAPVFVVTMADGSDDPACIEAMVRLVERGVVIAAASRYMSGGAQVGAPWLKGMLSRGAGISLRYFAGIGTHDATNSFKAYSTEFVRSVGIDSTKGFEIGIELVAKARRLRRPIAQIPTIWLERESGESNFRLREWIPEYMKWYRLSYGRQLSVGDLQAKCSGLQRKER